MPVIFSIILQHGITVVVFFVCTKKVQNNCVRMHEIDKDLFPTFFNKSPGGLSKDNPAQPSIKNVRRGLVYTKKI